MRRAFDSKLYEIERNFNMIAEYTERVGQMVSDLLPHVESLPYLMGSQDMEQIFDATMRYLKFKAEAEAVVASAVQCKERTEDLAREICGERYFGPFLEKEKVLASRVASAFMGVEKL
jgi:hypothetical protein